MIPIVISAAAGIAAASYRRLGTYIIVDSKVNRMHIHWPADERRRYLYFIMLLSRGYIGTIEDIDFIDGEISAIRFQYPAKSNEEQIKTAIERFLNNDYQRPNLSTGLQRNNPGRAARFGEIDRMSDDLTEISSY